MNETYQAKLSGSPPRPQPQPQPTMTDERGEVHILPNPHNPSQPIPVQLPNIYVNPYPPPAPAPIPTDQHYPDRHQRSGTEGTSHHLHQERQPHSPIPRSTTRMVKIGPFRFSKPHPLLWISLALSLIALVLEVPKGSLPTFTGRHKLLRNQERLVQERLHLLSRLSNFLPPPLASMIDPKPHAIHSGSAAPKSLEMLKFWNNHENAQILDFAGPGGGGEGGERWWSVEELGEGASVVRSKDGAGDREVWVLKVGEHGDGQTPLMNALTHSLLLRDRLLSELTHLKSQSSTALATTHGEIQQAPSPHSHSHSHSRPHSYQHNLKDEQEHENDRDQREQDREREQERAIERRRREKEREKEVEEREREVGRREKWVIDEMRKLTDKVHAEASELTLEDRITERLKAYQRQLSKISEEREKEL